MGTTTQEGTHMAAAQQDPKTDQREASPAVSVAWAKPDAQEDAQDKPNDGPGCCVKRVAAAYVRMPCFCLLFFLGAAFFVGVVLNVQMDQKNGNIFNQKGVFDWTITDTIAASYTDMYNSAVLQSSKDDGEEKSVPMSSGSANRYVLNVLYEYQNRSQDTNIFTPETLRDICIFENIWLGHENYTKFCIRPDNQVNPGNCTLPTMSILTRFYDRELQLTGELKGRPLSFIDQSKDKVSKTLTRNCSLLPWDGEYGIHQSLHLLNKMIEDPKMRELGGFFMSAQSLDGDDKATGYSHLTRSMLQLGVPLEGYADEYDRTLEQSYIYNEGFLDSVETEIFRYTGMRSKSTEESNSKTLPMFVKSPYMENATVGDHLRIEFYCFGMNILEFQRNVVGDFMWALGSILFVSCYIMSHIGSAFLTAISMFQIIMSLPLAYFIYTHILNIPFFTELHVLAIFLCLGVGADDIFVFMDCWNQCLTDTQVFKNDVRKMMEFTLSRTMVAVLNTSFTTAMSFIATATSPIMPLHSFGIYAAIAIMLLYVLAITITPVAVVVYYHYFACCFCKRCDTRLQFDRTNREADSQVPSDTAPTSESEAQDKTLPCTEKCFKYCWAPVLNFVRCRVKIFSLLFVVLFTAYVAQGLWFAMQLRTPTEQEKFFSDDHMFSSVTDRLSNDFISGADSNYITLYTTFGLRDLDRSKYNPYEPNQDRGVVSFDEDFDFAGSRDAQKCFLKLCNEMRALRCDLEGCFNSEFLARQDTNDRQYTKCFLEDFAAYWYMEYQNNRIPQRIAAGECTGLADCYVLPTAVPTTDQRSNESWIMEWIPDNKDTFIDEVKLFRKHQAYSGTYKPFIGIVNDKLKYASFSTQITLRTRQPYRQTKDIHAFILDQGEKWRSEESYPSKLGSKNKIIFSDVRWFSWADTEAGLLFGMFQGLQICMPVAFVVLLIASANFILAFVATFCIAGIVASVLGMCKSVMGWHLGIAESIAAVIVVGFAVDYIVHLCHIYAEAKNAPGMPHMTRGERVEEAVTVMGVTVLAGAVTTLGAGMFMYFCQMVFFTKMAFLMTATIVHSFMFALVYFMSILALAGPQGSTGDVSSVCSCCFARKSPETPQTTDDLHEL